MNTTYKYDPEDIESLLMHKQFNELYPEEKEFVLRHVEGPEEYDSLRQTLFLMHDAADQDEWMEPDPSIRKNLMAQFVSEEKKGFFVWLNSLFAAPSLPDMPWYRKPAMRYAFASVTLLAVIGGTWLYTSRSGDNGQIAVVDSKDVQNQTEATQQSPAEMTNAGNRTYADNLKPNVFPPAPAPVDEAMKYPNVQYIPTEESALEMVNEGNISDESKYEDYAADAEEMTDDVSLAAEPALSPAVADKTVRLEKENTTTPSKKETTSRKDTKSSEELDVAEAQFDGESESEVVATEFKPDAVGGQATFDNTSPVVFSSALMPHGKLKDSKSYEISSG